MNVRPRWSRLSPCIVILDVILYVLSWRPSTAPELASCYFCQLHISATEGVSWGKPLFCCIPVLGARTNPAHRPVFILLFILSCLCCAPAIIYFTTTLLTTLSKKPKLSLHTIQTRATYGSEVPRRPASVHQGTEGDFEERLGRESGKKSWFTDEARNGQAQRCNKEVPSRCC